jgi:hypothetical protein
MGPTSPRLNTVDSFARLLRRRHRRPEDAVRRLWFGKEIVAKAMAEVRPHEWNQPALADDRVLERRSGKTGRYLEGQRSA